MSQIAYGTVMGVPFAGLVEEEHPYTIVGRVNSEASSNLSTGVFVKCSASAADGVELPGASDSVLCGVTVYKPGVERFGKSLGTTELFAPKVSLDVIEKGRVWVRCETAMALGLSGTSLHIRYAGTGVVGAVRNAAVSSETRTAPPGIRVVKAATGAGVVLLEVDALLMQSATFNSTQIPESVVSIPVPALSAIANSGVLARFTPGYAGKIIKTQFQATTAVSTAAKLATLTPQIAGTPTTGGVLSLTTAGLDTIGKTVAGSAVTAANAFTDAQEITVVASSVTAFVEGAGVILITLGG